MIKQGTTIIKTNATNSELQNAIEAALPQAVEQTKAIASRYKGRTEQETCKKIFDYLKNQVHYKADGKEQQVRLPSALMRTLQGDCKSYALFTSAILTNLRVPHSLCYTSYDEKDPTPTHIYVITKNGCIIDAVYGKFNSEKQPTFKKLKNMNISYIAGLRGKKRIGSMGKYGPGGACGIGAVDTGETWAKKLGIWNSISAGDKLQFYANVGLPLAIGGREIVKALLRKNSGGFANSLSKIYDIAKANNASDEFKKYRAIEMQWFKKGGNPDELRVAFQEGNTKTPTGAYFNEMLLKQASGGNVTVPQWIAAGISAIFGKKYDPATGKITGGNMGIGADPASDTAVVVATAPWWGSMVAGIVTTLGLAAINKKSAPTPGDPTYPTNPTPPTTSTSSVVVPILLVGGAAAAYFILNKKKK